MLERLRLARRPLALLGVLLLALGAASVEAHELTPDQLRTVRFDQRLGAQVPDDLRFADENGTPVALGDYFVQRPVILTLNYFHCQNLCLLELDGLINGLNGLSFTLGQQFSIVSVSIDPRDGPAEAATIRSRARRGYDRHEHAEAWHVLTGEHTAIDRLAESIGFSYAYEPDADEFAHPLGAVVLTPTGQVSRYLYGPDFASNDLRLALIEATNGSIGTLLDRALLVCYHYDALTGRYTPLALNVMRAGGAVAMLSVLGGLGWLWRTDQRRRPPPPEAAA